MWINKYKYELEQLKYKQRIEYLEQLICPNFQHNFEVVDKTIMYGTGNGDNYMQTLHRCSNCGKMKITHDY